MLLPRPRKSAVAEIARLSTRDADFDARLARLTAFDAAQDQTVDAVVAEILAAVKSRGDAAVLEYTARFDGVTAATLAGLELPRELLARARDALPSAQREAKGVRGGGPFAVVTDIGILEPNDQGELILAALHPNRTLDEARTNTGWQLQVATQVKQTEPPSPEELNILRELDPQGIYLKSSA